MAKEKGIPILELQELCGLNKNAIAQAGKSQDGMKARNLYSIAELLEVSIDYLLGRTDSPNSHYNISNSQTTINGTQANVIHNAMGSDGLTDEFMKVFSELCFDDKVSVMQYVKDIKKSAAPQDGDRK